MLSADTTASIKPCAKAPVHEGGGHRGARRAWSKRGYMYRLIHVEVLWPRGYYGPLYELGLRGTSSAGNRVERTSHVLSDVCIEADERSACCWASWPPSIRMVELYRHVTSSFAGAADAHAHNVGIGPSLCPARLFRARWAVGRVYCARTG
jgi:hypothetical protein